MNVTPAALEPAAERLGRPDGAHGGRVEELDARPRRQVPLAAPGRRRSQGTFPRCEGISARR